MLMPGNGSGEWVKMLISDLMEHGSKLLLLDPDFFIYRRQAGFAAIDTRIVPKDEDGFISLDGMLEIIREEKPDLFMFSNPCNPTGQGFSRAEVRQIVEACGDAVVIVDEAYNDFYGESMIQDAVNSENIIVSPDLLTLDRVLGDRSVQLQNRICHCQPQDDRPDQPHPFSLQREPACADHRRNRAES